MGILRFLSSVLLASRLLQTGPVITAPVEGAILRGTVQVAANLGAAGYTSADLSFAYADDPTDTWFPLQTFSGSADPAIQFAWDTTTLTDGDYRLRLRLFAADGTEQEFIVKDLHLRNQSPDPTATPAPPTSTPDFAPPLEFTAAPAVGETLAAPPLNPITPAPTQTNPAAITAASVYSTFGRGALLALTLFAVLGLWLRLRSTPGA